jgi:Zinc carboxypeptidase
MIMPTRRPSGLCPSVNRTKPRAGRPRSSPPTLRTALLPLLVFLLGLPLGAQSPAVVPSPAEFLGFEPGADRKLADYRQVYAYFEKLAGATDRVRFSSIGRTTEDRELGFAIISTGANLANLEAIRKANLALADPRKLHPGEAESLVAAGKTIVCLNASIHSTEVAPTQATLGLAHFLATTQDPDWLRILDDVVLVMLPCHNPDGYEKVVEWYRKGVGTPHEGGVYPGLYHPYAGHDNNRDWFMFNLVETRLTVTRVYQRWLPQIVLDLHQMSEDDARMFVPPYQDPIEPNVDPVLIANLNELGRSVQTELIGKGLRGIVTSCIFDAWSPSRAYMHYHGGVRFLCEVAACRVATPIERRGLASNTTTRPELNPAPWSGDRWALSDAVRYQNAAALAVLRHASSKRTKWLGDFHDVFRRTCSSREGPAGYLIPFDTLSLPQAGREKLASAWTLLQILEMGQVECSVLAQPVMVAGREVRQGVVVQRGQPFFAFARALLDNVPYPDVRERPGGPFRRPYDTTAHCLPVMFGIEVLPLTDPLTPGSVLPRTGAAEELPRLSPDSAASNPTPPGVGVYQSYVPNVMDEGWLRFVLERMRTPYSLLTNEGIRALGNPETSKIRVLVLPALNGDQLYHGNRSADFPPDFRDGLGEEGASAIGRFVREGGTLIAINDAVSLAVPLLRLPIRNAFPNHASRRLAIPGALLRLDVDPAHPLAAGLAPQAAAMFDGGRAFETTPWNQRDQNLKPVVVARWAPAQSLRLAGYADGHEALAGKAAIVQCDVGKGQVILFGFTPQFRGQTLTTIPLLENAIRDGLKRK